LLRKELSIAYAQGAGGCIEIHAGKEIFNGIEPFPIAS
jgi:hypothetical protein